MAYELVPAYINTNPAGQVTMAATADSFAVTALVINAAGNFLNFGVVVPLYAVAILTTGPLPRWIGWLGLLVGVPAGCAGAAQPGLVGDLGHLQHLASLASSFMLSMGIALLRRRSRFDGVPKGSAPEWN